MKISHIDKNRNLTVNSIFNKSAQNIVEQIFSTQDMGKIEYMMSSEKNIEKNRHIYFEPNVDSVDVQSSGHINSNGMGVCEKRLLDKIKNSPYLFIILTGALGSGKSTIVNYVTSHIENNLNCTHCNGNEKCIQKAIIISVNFNELPCSIDKKEDVIIQFKKALFTELKSKIKWLFSNDNIMHFFEKELISSFENKKPNISNWVKYFDDLPFKLFRSPLKNWSNIGSNEKIEHIIDWIKTEHLEIDGRIEGLTQLFSSIRDRYPRELKGCLIIIFDNIDALRADVQQQIVTYLETIGNNIRMRIIIPVRLTTFGRINKSIGQQSYSPFEHAAPIPTDVIKKRIQHFIDNKNEYKLEGVNHRYLTVLESKLSQIMIFLTNSKDNRLLDAINAFSGSSIRRALFLSERLVINNILFDDKIFNQDSFIRALIIGDNEDMIMNLDDNLISNVFINPNGKRNSFICLRILQILYNHGTKKNKITLFDLARELRIFSPYNNETIIDSLDYLSVFSKRLIFYLSDKNIEDAIKNESHSKEFEIEITNTGKLYIEKLLSDLTYAQECFISIDWSIDEIKVSSEEIKEDIKKFINKKIEESTTSPTVHIFVKNMFEKPQEILELNIPSSIEDNSIIERLTVVRKILGVLLKHDALQMIVYRFNTKHDMNRPTAVNEFVVSNMIASLGSSAYKILAKDKDKLHTQLSNELLEWQNLCIIAFNLEKAVLSQNNRNLEQTIDLFIGENSF